MSATSNRRRWFDGVRLDTLEQDRMASRALEDAEIRSTETGDTLVLVRNGFITCYRQDWSIQLTAKEYNKRKWMHEEGPEAA